MRRSMAQSIELRIFKATSSHFDSRNISDSLEDPHFYFWGYQLTIHCLHHESGYPFATVHSGPMGSIPRRASFEEDLQQVCT
jgi:hypothetical protein